MKAVVRMRKLTTDDDQESKIILIAPKISLAEVLKLHLYEGRPFIMETSEMEGTDGEV